MGVSKQPTAAAASPCRKRSLNGGSMGESSSILSSRASHRNWLMVAAMSLMTLVFLLQMHASFSVLGSMGSSSQRLRGHLAWTEAAKVLNPFGAKKGIILCLHDGIAAMGASLIRELRCLGNREVVQVYHCLDSELSSKSRAVLTRNDPLVEIIDVCADLQKRNVRLPESMGDAFQSYWIKPLALTHTSLTEVILLDADAILLRDPAVLRFTKGYRDHGSVFFYDRVTGCHKFLNKHAHDKQLLQHIVKNFNYKRFGVQDPRPSKQLLASLAYNERTCHEQDSSMVVVNKAQASRAMDVLWYLISTLRFRYRFSWYVPHAHWLMAAHGLMYLLSAGATRRPSGSRTSSRNRHTTSLPTVSVSWTRCRIRTSHCTMTRSAAAWRTSCRRSRVRTSRRSCST